MNNCNNKKTKKKKNKKKGNKLKLKKKYPPKPKEEDAPVEVQREHLIRLQLRQRIQAAVRMGMQPEEFAEKLLAHVTAASSSTTAASFEVTGRDLPKTQRRNRVDMIRITAKEYQIDMAKKKKKPSKKKKKEGRDESLGEKAATSTNTEEGNSSENPKKKKKKGKKKQKNDDDDAAASENQISAIAPTSLEDATSSATPDPIVTGVAQNEDDIQQQPNSTTNETKTDTVETSASCSTQNLCIITPYIKKMIDDDSTHHEQIDTEKVPDDIVSGTESKQTPLTELDRKENVKQEPTNSATHTAASANIDLEPLSSPVMEGKDIKENSEVSPIAAAAAAPPPPPVTVKAEKDNIVLPNILNMSSNPDVNIDKTTVADSQQAPTTITSSTTSNEHQASSFPTAFPIQTMNYTVSLNGDG